MRDAIADLQDVPAVTEVDAPPVELQRMDNLSALAQVLRGKLLYKSRVHCDPVKPRKLVSQH